jgi:hypothetical protein
MWLYWRKKRKKSFKKTENKLVTENGKQKLEEMMDRKWQTKIGRNDG